MKVMESHRKVMEIDGYTRVRTLVMPLVFEDQAFLNVHNNFENKQNVKYIL